MTAVSTKQKKQARSSPQHLTPELRELAHIAAKCLYERPAGNVGGVPRQAIGDMIAIFGSAKLREFWHKKSNLVSVDRCGYIRAVPLRKRALFRQQRSEQLATMLSEGNVAAVEVENEDEKRKTEPTSSQLNPEFRELARIAAKCLYERPAGNIGGVPWHIMHDRIATFGSEKLKQLWQEKSTHLTVSERGYNLAVPKTKRAVFRQYRDELLAKMLSEGKSAVDLEDFDEEWTIRIGKSVVQEKDSVDGKQKGSVDGSDVGGQENSASNYETSKISIDFTKENERNAIDNHVWLAPAAKPQIAKSLTVTRRPLKKGISIDNILNLSKNGGVGRLSANASLPDSSPSTMPPDLEELARLVAECTDVGSSKICHETLARKVLSSECQMLKDRWNGMARLSRFQRDGYSMLIPRSMRNTFQIHRDYLISNRNTGTTGMVGDAAKQNSKQTYQLQEAPPGATPRPQMTNQLTGAASIRELSVTTKYQTADDIGYEGQSWESSGDPLESAKTIIRQRHGAAFSNEHRSEGDSSTKRLKTAHGTVPSKSIEECKHGISLPFKCRPIEEYKHAIRLFFTNRHRRLDLAQEQFLDEPKCGWQASNINSARSNLRTHHDVELDKLTELEKRCCASFQVGSSQCLLAECFFEVAAMNWKAFLNEEINAWGSVVSQDWTQISERKQRDRYRIFLDAEKSWVQRHLETMSSE